MSTKMYQSTKNMPQYKRTPSDNVKHVGLNPAQLHFLQVLSHIKTNETFMELKRLVRNFYAQQLQKEADKCWAEGKINDNLLNEHLRTPYL